MIFSSFLLFIPSVPVFPCKKILWFTEPVERRLMRVQPSHNRTCRQGSLSLLLQTAAPGNHFVQNKGVNPLHASGVARCGMVPNPTLQLTWRGHGFLNALWSPRLIWTKNCLNLLSSPTCSPTTDIVELVCVWAALNYFFNLMSSCLTRQGDSWLLFSRVTTCIETEAINWLSFSRYAKTITASLACKCNML